jgi:hypothetical protein
MADDKGRPIHESSPVSPIGGVAANATPAGVDPHAPKCVACGRYHGSINVSTRCLEDKVRELRAELARRGGPP